MLRHISLQNLQSINFGELVEPMVWVYAEDIYRFVQPAIWDKYAAVFKTAWTASAFKGEEVFFSMWCQFNNSFLFI